MFELTRLKKHSSVLCDPATSRAKTSNSKRCEQASFHDRKIIEEETTTETLR